MISFLTYPLLTCFLRPPQVCSVEFCEILHNRVCSESLKIHTCACFFGRQWTYKYYYLLLLFIIYLFKVDDIAKNSTCTENLHKI